MTAVHACHSQALKNQRSKVSKADKLSWKSEKKAITKSLQAVKAEAAALRHGPLAMAASASAAAGQAPGDGLQPTTMPAFSGFDLPMPTRQGVAVAGFNT